MRQMICIRKGMLLVMMLMLVLSLLVLMLVLVLVLMLMLMLLNGVGNRRRRHMSTNRLRRQPMGRCWYIVVTAIGRHSHGVIWVHVNP